jgi:uncharacterized protein (DUF362 family)/ferredoxin-like protein FixX
MKSKVAVIRCLDYDPEHVKEAVSRAIDLLGGVTQFVAPGDRVLVKPNLLSARLPEAAVTTHPAVVEAVIDLWKAAGAEVILGDSPPIAGEKEASYRRLMQNTGMLGVAERTGARIVRFEESVVPVEYPSGRHYKRFEIGRAVSEADAIISLPKLKSHGLTYLTGGVKNMFGCIHGKRKAFFHAQAGEDREIFAQMLVDFYGAVTPQLSIMDAIVGMDGDGPVDGRVRNIGLILAGTDAVAVDAVASAILGIDPLSVDTTRLAATNGLGKADLTQIDIVGEKIEDIRCDGFIEPKSKDFWTRIPKPIRHILRNQLIPFPNITPSCKNCNACVDACPVKAIAYGKDRPKVELTECIRCYCCREVCEHKAIELKLGRLSAGVRFVREVRRVILHRRHG